MFVCLHICVWRAWWYHSLCLYVHDPVCLCVITVHVCFPTWFSAAHCFLWLQGRAVHSHTVRQHGRGGEIEQGRVNMTKIKVVPSQPVPCGVSSCMSVSVSLQILMWNPAGADRTFFEQQARSAQYGPDVEVIDSRAVTGAIESTCGKWGTLQPHSLQPWGGKRERDKCRVRGKRKAKQISSLHGHEDWMNKWQLQTEWRRACF